MWIFRPLSRPPSPPLFHIHLRSGQTTLFSLHMMKRQWRWLNLWCTRNFCSGSKWWTYWERLMRSLQSSNGLYNGLHWRYVLNLFPTIQLWNWPASKKKRRKSRLQDGGNVSWKIYGKNVGEAGHIFKCPNMSSRANERNQYEGYNVFHSRWSEYIARNQD